MTQYGIISFTVSTTCTPMLDQIYILLCNNTLLLHTKQFSMAQQVALSFKTLRYFQLYMA